MFQQTVPAKRRLLHNGLVAAITLLAGVQGLRAQDIVNVPCDGSVGGTYCYVDNDDHSWHWESECPGDPIILQFTGGTIEGSGYDLLVIYDGPDDLAPVLYFPPLGTESLELAGLQITSTGTDMFMTFNSNSTNCCATGGLLGGGQTEWVFSASSGNGTAGVHEEQAGNFTMYPNPAGSELHLRLSSNTNGNAEIRILDVTGRIVYQNRITATGGELNTIDLNGLQSGNYSVVLSTAIWVRTRKLEVIR
ncbi:MAG: T9SS type A sorting domain-containing protein [Bacteroidetes bacterium]|nr:T9SS type A sorting domain-containing protein [Bacteroidota bacterium]